MIIQNGELLQTNYKPSVRTEMIKLEIHYTYMMDKNYDDRKQRLVQASLSLVVITGVAQVSLCRYCYGTHHTYQKDD